MIELQETIVVKRPIADVFKYTARFEHIEQWDPGVSASVKLGQGPERVGMRYGLILKFAFFRPRMTYTMVTYDPLKKVVLEGRGDSFSAVDTICFSETDTGTQVAYTARLHFSGAASKLRPFLRPVLRRVGRKAVLGLKHALTHQFVPKKRFPPCPRQSLPGYLADRAVLPGMLGFSRQGYHVSRGSRKPNTVFLTGKSVVITGATSGIGKAALLALARMDARVTFIARSREKAAAVKQEIAAETGNDSIDFYVADLSLMADINSVCRQIQREKPRIDILVNNAGALFPRRMETAEGVEKTLAVNLMGVFLLTERLAPLMAGTADPRIVNVASGGMYTRRIDVTDLSYSRTTPYNGAAAYARAKRGVVILTELWAALFGKQGIKVNAMHPGWVDTPGIQYALPRFHRLTRPLLRTPWQGADTIVWLASAREAVRCTGQFWLDRRPRPTHVFPCTRASERERNLLYSELTNMTGKRLRHG